MSYGDYPDLSCVKKILVIKLRHLGDVLLTSPLFTLLKEHLPNAAIDALIYEDTYPVLEGHPAISHFLFCNRQSKTLSFFEKSLKELRLWKEIYNQKYDLVINLTEGDRGALAALVSRSRIRVGFDPEHKGFIFKKKIYTHLIKNCKTPRHTVEKHLDSLRRIGIFPPKEKRELFLHVPQDALNSVKTILKAPQFENFIVIHPVSRWMFKSLPAEKIAHIIQKLTLLGYQIVLTSGPNKNECQMVEKIESLCNENSALLNLAGRISLKELAALITLSKCLICVDSVPLHIASALKAPVVAIFGPTSEINWGPWKHPFSFVVSEKFSCRPCHLDGCGGSKMSDCLYSLSEERILEAVQMLITKTRSVEKLVLNLSN